MAKTRQARIRGKPALTPWIGIEWCGSESELGLPYFIIGTIINQSPNKSWSLDYGSRGEVWVASPWRWGVGAQCLTMENQ